MFSSGRLVLADIIMMISYNDDDENYWAIIIMALITTGSKLIRQIDFSIQWFDQPLNTIDRWG